jgi:hypothetical protein
MYPHRIRLRGPWECEPLSRRGGSSELPQPCTVTMPCRWRDVGLGEFAGRVRLRRRFGLPRQIDNYERVWLTFAGLTGVADIWVNGQSLGRCCEADCPFEREVTALLKPRNELVVELEETGGDGGLWGEVALEIRCTAYLRSVHAWLAQQDGSLFLHAAGAVIGVAERPLDLYALLDGRTVAYITVEPRPDGTPFQITSEALERRHSFDPAEVRVELVNGGTVWYRVTESVVAPASAAPERKPRCP